MIDTVKPERPWRIKDRRAAYAALQVTRIPQSVVTCGGVSIVVVVTPGYGRRQGKRLLQV